MKHGINEWLNFTENRSRFTIYDSKFKEGHTFNFPSFEIYPFIYGIKKTINGNRLYIQTGDYYYVFNYYKNPYFYVKYITYILIYTLMLGLVFLILKGQKIRLDKRLAIEKEIMELQIKTIKNQIDPHFVFNAMNTISEMILTDNKVEVDDFICKF